MNFPRFALVSLLLLALVMGGCAGADRDRPVTLHEHTNPTGTGNVFFYR